MKNEFTEQMPLPFGENEEENAQTNAQPQKNDATGIATPAANPPRSSILTLDEIKQMTPAEITARWAEVAEVLSNN